MSKLLDKLVEAKEKGITLCAVVNCKKLMVEVEEVDDDMVTLKDTKSSDEYFLHYTAVVICGKAN